MNSKTATEQQDQVWRTTSTQQWTYGATATCGDFYDLLKAVTSITRDCAMMISPAGIEIRACDPANVAAIHVDSDCVNEAAGGLRAGINAKQLLDGLPPYHDRDDEYGISVKHGHGDDDEQDQFIVSNSEGSVEVAAFDPDKIRDAADVKPLDGGVEFELPTPKIRGILGGLADTDVGKLRLKPEDGYLHVDARNSLNEEDIQYQWTLDADIQEADAAYYSTDYVSDVVHGMVPTGTTRVEFESENILRIHQEDFKFYVAPRINPHKGGDGDE